MSEALSRHHRPHLRPPSSPLTQTTERASSPSSEPPPQLLRPLAHIELFSSTRHHRGIYRCVVVTSRYRSSSSAPLDHGLLCRALARVVAAEPMLRVGIWGQHTNHARFTHIPELDLRHHIDTALVQCASLADYHLLLDHRQASLHDQIWPLLESRPPWKITLLQPKLVAPDSDPSAPLPLFWDLAFAFHHSLMDGISGGLFHQRLLAALNQLASQPDPRPESAQAASLHLLRFPTPPVLPERQEDAIRFQNSILFVLKSLGAELAPSWLQPWIGQAPPPWHGNLIDYSHHYRTRVRTLDLAPDLVSSLRRSCSQHQTSITALFHSLCLVILAQSLPPAEASSFAAATPINLRPYLQPTPPSQVSSGSSSLRCLITSHSHRFQAPLVASLRTTANLDQLESAIWQIASRVKAELSDKLASLPNDDMSSLIKYLPDWFAYWDAKDQTPRPHSWEISNIGLVEGCDLDAGPWSIHRVVFTNGAMPAGAPMAINMATLAPASLTLALSWQESAIPTHLADAILPELAAYLERHYKTGRFCG